MTDLSTRPRLRNFAVAGPFLVLAGIKLHAYWIEAAPFSAGSAAWYATLFLCLAPGIVCYYAGTGATLRRQVLVLLAAAILWWTCWLLIACCGWDAIWDSRNSEFWSVVFLFACIESSRLVLNYYRPEQPKTTADPTPAAAVTEGQSANRLRPTSRRQLWFRFWIGLLYLACLANFFSEVTGCTSYSLLAALVAITLLCVALALFWMALWARRKDSQLGQFGIGSLLFLMVFAAIFFDVVAWVADRCSHQTGYANNGALFCSWTVACLLVTCLSLPFVLGMGEAVLWAAVWVLKRPPVRRLAIFRKGRL